MSNKPTPKFMKPGDDPELDRLLEKARREGSEPPGEYYYDLFGRRRRLAVVDQDAPTIPGSPWASKGVEIDSAALPSALMPAAPAPSTGPVVTETPAGVPAKMTQARVLRLATMAIGGPVLVMVIGATWMNSRVPVANGSIVNSAASTTDLGVHAAPPVSSGTPAPTMTAEPAIVEDAGAATTAPSGTSSAPLRPTDKVPPRVPRPKSPDDPYSNPPVTPRKPDAGSKIW
jgi:hypothetical protein